MSLNWTFSNRSQEMKSSVIREILKITERPEIISFAGGLPAPELFPIDEIREACLRVLESYGAKALQYSLTMGIPALRTILAERISRKGGVNLTADNILITEGSQQALDMVGRVFLDSGTTVIVEDPSYLGAIQAFNAYRCHYITIEMDENGIKVDQVEEKIKRFKPRFIYVVPNFQNPTGITMSYERRKRLVELAKEYYIPIIDDNPYGELRFTGKDVPSLKALGGDLVIQLGTISKIISPGFRIGWIAAPLEIMGLFEKMKQAMDLHTNTFAQYVILEYMKSGIVDKHIEEIKKAYGERREVMLKAMEEFFPKEIKWTKPEGGLFLWAVLPENVSATKLLEKAIEAKVAYVPGGPFFANGDHENTLRLNFSNAKPDMIIEGIKRLGKVFRENII